QEAARPGRLHRGLPEGRMVAASQVTTQPEHAVRHEWEARCGKAGPAYGVRANDPPRTSVGSSRKAGSHPVSDLIDTTEMYLRTIYELQEEGIVPLRARIAERLGHSGPTVSQTVARMERDGLLHV